MTREDVMSTPIFDQLLREMAQRAEPRPTAPAQEAEAAAAESHSPARRRHHRAE